MNIGSAIRTLRKQKGITQKELAEKCEISVNAISQIEKNGSFPQKSTLKKICQALTIPPAYLLLFSITEEDVPAEKRIMFESIGGALKSLLLSEL